MDMIEYIIPISIALIAMFATIVVLDYVWLGIVLSDFLKKEFKPYIEKQKDGSIKIKLWAGLIAWALLSIGTYIFAVLGADNISIAILTGALFGLITYGVYDLTNLTFFPKYSKKFTIIDIIWGTVLCSIMAAVGYIVEMGVLNYGIL